MTMKLTLILGICSSAVLLLTACRSGGEPHALVGSIDSAAARSSSSTPSMGGMDMGTGSPGSAAPLLSGTAASGHNAADITFAQMMIPHHASAIDMANKEVIDGRSAQVKALARKIMAAQAPEITAMNAWLTAWKVNPAGHQGEGSTVMPGMMSAADAAKFRALKGPALDRSFLTLMIAHHQGALSMAATEANHGMDPQATALARSITASQTAEIAAMKALLTALPN
jgi:uncharacterized protein (DUF305 family)